MILTVDGGNSNVKLGWFEGGKLVKHLVIKNTEFNGRWKELLQLNLNDSSATKAVISNVGPLNLADAISAEIDTLYEVRIDSKFPFEIEYNTKDTLGIDRLIGCAGAHKLCKNESLLVIDIGTCITFDYVIDNRFKGGAISPGIELRAKSMNDYTANLPLVEMVAKEDVAAIGKSTEEALKAGIYHGILAEIKHAISLAKNTFSGINVFLTGGQLDFFEEALKNDIFAERNLIHHGLDEILRLND